MILHFFKKCLCYQHFLCHSCLSFHYTLQFRLLLILFSSSCFFNKPVVYFFMSVFADMMIIHQLRKTIFNRSLHLISDSKKLCSYEQSQCIILHLQALLSHQFQPPKRVSPPRYIPLSSARSRNDILCKCLPLYR